MFLCWCVISDEKPVGVEMVLAVPAISALDGDAILSPYDDKLCGKPTTPPTQPGFGDRLVVDTPDFSVRLDAKERAWTMSWK